MLFTQELKGKSWGRTPPDPTKILQERRALLFRDSERQHIETMDSVYKLSPTERIQLLEKELAVKLSELKTELEEQGLPGTANRVFR